MKKKCFIVILSLICMFCISFCLVACGETPSNPNTGTHTHQYVWQDNGDGTHKQHCSVSGCDAPDINVENHTYGSNDKCIKCNAQKPAEPHSHVWSLEWASDDIHHWHNCTADECDILDNAQKDGYAEHDFSSGDCICGKAHQHIWLQTWESDDTHHWHKCQASGNGCTLTATSEMYGYAEHDFSSGDCICGKQANFTEGLEYEFSDTAKAYTVTGLGTATETDIIIPDYYQGYPVNYIGKYAFKETAITSIKFGKNIREVEHYAFYGCTSLKRVDLNYGCWCYGYSCFQNCTSLERIELPDRKCDIGTDIFAGCTSLEYAYLGKTTWLSNRSFNGCSNLKTLVADYIHSDLQGDDLFAGCTNLKNFNIPDAVEKVTKACFQDTKLITVQNNIEYVGGWAVGMADEEQATASLSFRSGTTGINAIEFVGITAITEVHIPATLKHFYGYFSRKVTKIYISDLEGYLKLEFTEYGPVTNLNSDGYQLYLNGSELKTLTIPSSITVINENAFYNCQSIETINIHNNVSKIGRGAFDKCNNIQYTEYKNGNYIGSIGGPVVLFSMIDKTQTTFEFAPNTKTISTTAFAGSKIINLTIPESVENIGASAFNGMKSLISVTLPNSITSIPECAFAYCTALEEITIPDSVTTIYGGAFYSCTALKTVNFGANSQLETIKMGYNTYSTNYIGAFEKTAIESISFPSTLKTIGSHAFASCKNITSLTIGSSVTYIGAWAFEKCTGLETLTINGTSETEIGAYAFEECSGLKTANISVYFINTCAFSKCTSLTDLTLNEGLHQLAYLVFSYCTSLYSVTLPASLKYIQKDIFKNCTKLVELQNLSGTELTKEDVPSVLTFRALGTQSEIFRQNDFVFFRDSVGITYILAYEGSQTEITLPTIAGGYELLEGAFKACKFTKVTIPEGVTAIPDNAFASCSKLVEINLPSTIASISLKAFISCENITAFNISENNPNYICDGGIVYNRAKTQIVFVPFSVSGVVELPETITIIEKEAFDSIMNVTQLSMLGVTEIKVGGCCYMTSLKSIIVSSALTSIGRHAFAEDEEFDTVYFKGTEEQWNAISISDTTITKCTIYYYSETNSFEGENAVTEGNFWHFDTDGKTPILWQVAE